MKFQLITVFVLVLLFFPIPLKLSLNYSDSTLIFCIYKFQIVNTGKKKKKKKSKKKKKRDDEPEDSKKRIKKKKKRENKDGNFDFKRLLYSFIRRDSKFLRMFSKLEFKLIYGLEDAYICSMLYGGACSIFGILPNILNNFINLKKYDFKVEPVFNRKVIDFSMCLRVYFNIVYLIYAGIFVLINSRKKREV